MMENSNYLYDDRDSLILQMRPNNRGSYTINSIEFTFDGFAGDVNIDIYFGCLENGIIESDWEYVGTASADSYTVNTAYDVPRSAVFQIKFVRIGNGDEIEFKQADIDATFFTTAKQTPTLNESIFANLNDDVETDILENNLFKKLYLRGIVPDYIKRAANLSKKEDKDYIAMFSTVARFFTLIIRFFKRWEHIIDDEEMLKEVLRNNSIQFNETQITLAELQSLVQNLYNEIAKRGTPEIFRRIGETRPDGTVVTENGEFMRMINADAATEILMETIPHQELGWCTDRSSPLYRGIPNDCLDLDKMNYSNKKSHKFTNADDYNKILKFGNYTLVDDNTVRGEGQVIRFTNESGIGRSSSSSSFDKIRDYVINVDACMDYEIVAGIRVVSTGGVGETNKLYASVEGFNINGIKLPDAFVSYDKSTVFEDFFDDGVKLSKFVPGHYYYIRFIIRAYASEATTDEDGKLNIGYGHHLCFNNAFVRYILPTIRIDGGSINVCNYHIRPLVRGTNIGKIIGEQFENCFSLGFVQACKFFHLYLRSRNKTMSQKDVAEFIDRYLLTYSSASLLTFIE